MRATSGATCSSRNPRRGSQFLVLDGEITPQTSFVFQAIVEQATVEGLVIAQSPGGDLLAAHQIGRTIKRQRMNTLVLVSCISACVDIFVAGRNREMTNIAELGLHSATNRDVSYQLDRKYWREMGFPTINEKAYRVPNNRLWIMDAGHAPANCAWPPTSSSNAAFKSAGPALYRRG